LRKPQRDECRDAGQKQFFTAPHRPKNGATVPRLARGDPPRLSPSPVTDGAGGSGWHAGPSSATKDMLTPSSNPGTSASLLHGPYVWRWRACITKALGQLAVQIYRRGPSSHRECNWPRPRPGYSTRCITSSSILIHGPEPYLSRILPRDHRAGHQ
jgi:hypothetical protein